MQAQSHIEPDFAPLAELLEAAIAQAGDVAHSLSGWLARAETDPEALREVDERLSQWLSLARRWRRTPEELPATLAAWQAELARLDSAADLAALQTGIAQDCDDARAWFARHEQARYLQTRRQTTRDRI